MHYKNGREAKEGDKVVLLHEYASQNDIGIIFHVIPGCDTCNASLAPIDKAKTVSLKDCLHADDIVAAEIPDTSKK